MFESTALVVIVFTAAIGVYAYGGYPLALTAALGLRRRNGDHEVAEWPAISIVIPAYNEELSIRRTIERFLEADYPRDRMQILVVSDCSTDRTDDIVREYADRRVDLLRLPIRGGKTAAENAARAHLRGEIVIQTDASVLVDRAALKPLVAAFADPTVGVASGRDVSVGNLDGDVNAGESGYVGYEMWVRRLETRLDGIVGASGCFYATRHALHMEEVPAGLSRDFAAPLVARKHGFRSVSVDAAVCYVPRTGSIRREYRRKVRTMSRGIQTLGYMRGLLNPFRYGLFAWMLFSHKLARWLLPLAVLASSAAMLALAPARGWAAAAAAVGVVVLIIAGVVWRYDGRRALPRAMVIPAYATLGIIAGMQAWLWAVAGRTTPVWEPTRRG